jgi:uncharacterized protein YoxC
VAEWFRIVLALCAVALTCALVGVLLSLKRVLDRAGGVLTVVETEIRPTAAEARALTSEMRTLSRHLQDEIDAVGLVIERVRGLVDGLSRVVTGLAGLTRAGQVIGIAAGVRKGIEVFVERWRSRPGESAVAAQRRAPGRRRGGA